MTERREAPAPRTVEGQLGKMTGGEPGPVSDPVVALSTRIPESVRKRLRIAALRNDMVVQDVVVEALRDWLTKHDDR